MHVIKHIPEDFIVSEIPLPDLPTPGDYAIFEMKKREHTTPDAVRRLSEEMRLPLRNFGFAGNKDRNAITAQCISVFKGHKEMESIQIRGITLVFKGYSSKNIALGDLLGNAFIITVRCMDDDAIKRIRDFEKENKGKPILMPNYYGPQRFSSANHLIGREIVRKDFKAAIDLVLAHDHEHSRFLEGYLKENPNNAIGALRLLPQSTLRMYIHAYQSYLFNVMLKRVIDETKNNKLQESPILPLIGFGTETDEYNESVQEIINTALKGEKITQRDFISRQMPELSSEGDSREAFFTAPDFNIQEEGDDEYFKGMKKMKVSFTLQKSCYATTLLSYALDGCSDILNHRV